MDERSSGYEGVVRVTTSPARLRAAQALGKILRHGAYSNILVHQVSKDLGDPDRKHLQLLVYTALRKLRGIDEIIGAASSRELAQIQPDLLDILRIGVAELVALGTPRYAVVHSTVDSARAVAGDRAAGFVNAVLRQIGRQDAELDPVTFPAWMVTKLEAALGADDSTAFMESADQEARIGVRVRSDDVALTYEPMPGVDRVGYASDPAGIGPLADAGAIVVIDPASSVVGNAVAAEPGECVLDMAAAPGGKTVHLWDAMKGSGLLVAADRNAKRLGRARRRLTDIGVDPAWVVMDGTAPAFRPGSFDRVLLDAPCTGLGTLRRRPEIRHRLTPDSPAQMGQVQRGMLARAMELVKPGGTVIYSVCTVFAEETSHVVEDFGGEAPDGLPGVRVNGGLLLGPATTGTDGMFISRISR